MDIRTILTITTLLSMAVAGAALLLVKGRLYRSAAGLVCASLIFGVYLDYGIYGLAIAVFVLCAAFPLALMGITRIVFFWTWRNVRKCYPEEPEQPPVQQLTIKAAYRLMLAID